MSRRFVSEEIKPVLSTIDSARMAIGEPGLAREFQWCERTIRIAEVLRTWRETGPCHHGSGEMYVRKHWFEVRTAEEQIMRIYFERQPRKGSHKATQRWFLFSVESEAGGIE